MEVLLHENVISAKTVIVGYNIFLILFGETDSQFKLLNFLQGAKYRF